MFLQGLPALVAGLGLLILTGLSLAVPTWEVESRYYEQGRAAYQARDFPLALTCFERACAQGTERPETLYVLALTAEALGQSERALLLMTQLAPPDRQGYGEAHLWMAVRLLQASPQTAASRKAAEGHLLRALEGEIKDRELAHVLLGELYFAAGQMDQAEAHLSKGVKARPVTRLRLARLYGLRGDRERARREAMIAVEYFRARAKADLQNHFARFAWADAVTFLEEFPEALAILEEGWSVSQKQEYRTAQGQVCASWSDHLVRGHDNKDLDHLKVVEKGLAYDPTNPALLNFLLAVLKSGGPDGDKARAALQGMLARGEAAGAAHFALGVDAWHCGNAHEARLHWERSSELAPQLTAAANNLAMLLMETEPPDLPRALQLINVALQQAPNHPGYRDTRGRVYAKMGKWREALSDLEASLSKSPADPTLHRILATVYENLGVAGMAEEHRRLADQLAAKQKPKG